MVDETRLAKLRWRSRRGMLELDLMLERFLEREFLSLDESKQNDFERLLKTEDTILYAWLMKTEAVEDKSLEDIVDRVSQCTWAD